MQDKLDYYLERLMTRIYLFGILVILSACLLYTGNADNDMVRFGLGIISFVAFIVLVVREIKKYKKITKELKIKEIDKNKN